MSAAPPSSPHPRRRLAAVLLADVAGYARLMGRDETGTHMRLREIRAQITDPAFARHHGRIVRTAGDNMLVEFASAVEALSAAVDIQREMAAANRDLAPDARIAFRIGINLGDILIDGTDIAGEGVNVAARLETLAQPGGILISQSVREQVRQVVGISLDHAGTHRVKNIARPIRVYTVRMDEERGKPRFAAVYRRWWRMPAMLALAAMLGFGAFFLMQTLRQTDRPPASIVVLPFSSAAGGSSQALADRVTAEITTALTSALGASVVGRSTAARYRGRTHDFKRIGADLEVRYALEGSLAVTTDRIRLASELISAETGVQLWAGSIEVAREGDAVPDELIGRVVDQLVGELRTAELKRPRKNAPTPYELSLQARADLPHTTTAEQLAAVRALYERALQIDPHFVPALAGRAFVLSIEAGRQDDPAETQRLLAMADAVSLEAIARGPADAEVWRNRAHVLHERGQAQAAAEASQRAFSLAPHSSEVQAQVGVTLLALERAEEALAAFDRAIRLNPTADTVGVHLFNRCKALLFLGRYADALQSCTRSLAFSSDWSDYLLLTAIHAQMGNREAAAAARSELLQREPRFRISWIITRDAATADAPRPLRDKHLIAGLRKAGLPE